jgi:O-antigen ligase
VLVFLWVALALALARFGGTEAYAAPGLAILFALGLLALGIDGFRRGILPGRGFLIGAAAAAFLAVFVDAGLALPLAAGLIAAEASGRREAPISGFFHLLLLVGILEALVGLFQHFVAPGWVLGHLNDRPGASGTLINRNHFAGLEGMLIPVAIGLAYISWRRHRDPGRTYLYLLAGSVMGLALVFSLSRMGIFSFLLTLGWMAVLLRRAHSFRLGSALALVPLTLVLAASAWVGVDVITERFGQLVTPEGAIEDSRWQVFRDTARMIGDNPMGVGVGHFADTFRRYQTAYNAYLFDHAHNDYLESAAEWGIPLALAFWAWVFLVYGRTVRAFTACRDPERRGLLLVLVGALTSMLLHSLVDFNLQIPSNAMLFAAFLGLAHVMSRDRPEAPSAPRPARRFEPAVACGIAFFVIVSLQGPFRAAWMTRGRPGDLAVYEQAIAADPGNADYHFRLAGLAGATPYLDRERARRHYLEAVRLNPDHTAYWLSLARFREAEGDRAGVREALAEALGADPRDAATHWAAANVYLRLGEAELAEEALVRAAAFDPAYVQRVLDLVWNVYREPEAAMAVYVPDTRAANLTALRYFLAEEDETGARLAWERLRRFPTEPGERLGYVDMLITRGRAGEAYAVFLGSESGGGGPSPPAFYNGGFESAPMNGGFDWRYASAPAEVRRDTTQSRDGRASLLVRFGGEENTDFRQVSHLVAVEPGRDYELSFWMRTEGISTDKGVYVEVAGERSEPVLGTTFWEEFRIPFTASSDLVTVRVRRDPSQRFDNLLSGRVWLDAFELAETP